MPKREATSGWDKAVGVKRGKYAAGTLGWIIGQYRLSPEYQQLAPASKKTREQAFDRLHDYGHEDFNGLRRRHIMKIRDDLAETPGIANIVLGSISALCRYALDREIIEMDPCRGVKRLQIGEWRRWTDEEVQRFYDTTYEALRRVLVLALYTGQRRAELCRAVWSDIDGGEIKVTQQKTGTKLRIPVHPTLAAHLAEWKRDAETVTILAHSDRRPWKPLNVTQSFSNEILRLNMRGCTIHGLRKTAAAKLAEAGCSTRQIMAITGHASLEEVERYTREAEQLVMARDAMDRYTGIIEGVSSKSLTRKKK